MSDTSDQVPSKMLSLHEGEKFFRIKALEIIAGNELLQQHLAITEAAMDLADVLRQFHTIDEDLKVIQLLGMRTFNAFGASVNLTLSGYHQNAVLILRDVMETVFLIDYFAGDRSLIERWRFADKKVRRDEFGPVKVRLALDKRDGVTSKRRFEMYEMFSELAGHPTMKSAFMMRAQPEGDAVIGPFMEATVLETVISEMGRLAVQVGEKLNLFFPADWDRAIPSRLAFAQIKMRWIDTHYPHVAKPSRGTAASGA